MSSKKNENQLPELSAGSTKKRKILADLHSGMVLLARFAGQTEEVESPEPKASDSRRSNEVRQVLRTPPPPKKHRWN
jgi:hypothetical protein